MEKLTNEQFAEIIRDKEICEFCEDCGNDEICINCEKVNPATVAELRLFWKELAALVEARDEGRVVVLPEDGMLYHFEEIPETGERWVGNKPIQKIIFSCGFGLVGIPFDFSQLGKTVFLTRAEAEAALSGGVK